MTDLRIAEVRVTPIAFADPPLLNNAGCHQPFALRSVIEVETEGGFVGLGESYGAKPLIEALERMRMRDAGGKALVFSSFTSSSDCSSSFRRSSFSHACPRP